MTIGLNALEIFEIAEQIEESGAVFYRKAAGLFNNPQTNRIFLQLADWEIKHKKLFSDMRKQLVESKTFEHNGKVSDLSLLAGLSVFAIRPNPRDTFSGSEDEITVIKSAIEKEKDSVVFYSGLKEYVPDTADKETIDKVIKEEIHHIGILGRLYRRKRNIGKD